jgi:hypothetical protein
MRQIHSLIAALLAAIRLTEAARMIRRKERGVLGTAEMPKPASQQSTPRRQKPDIRRNSNLMRKNLPTPIPTENALKYTFCCFPPASPNGRIRPGKQKAPRRVPLNILILLDPTGAGDEIRTHDPNLGKVMLYP